MSNILFVYERDMATVSIMRMSFGTFFANGEVNCIFKTNKKVNNNDIYRADVLILIRSDNTLSKAIAKKARLAGCFIIFFMDDDLFCLPSDMPSIPWRQTALKKNLCFSDMLFTGSPYICEKYSLLTRQKRGVIIDTTVSKEEIKLIPQKKAEENTIKLVYAAGLNHEALFYQYIYPILPELDHKYGNRISLSFVGVHPKIEKSKFSFEIFYYNSRPLEEYRKFMREMNFDIGLSPLSDNLFSNCKYFNKFIEYTLVGTVGIYSNCKPYIYVVKDGVNGFLADNHPKEWLKVISKAIDDQALCQNCHRHAAEQLKTRFSKEKITETLMKEIPEIKQKKKFNKKVSPLIGSKLWYKFLRIADVLYLLLFFFRRLGIKGVIAKMKVHVKESRRMYKNM